MTYTNKGQASPRSSFFHITLHKDGRWYAVDVHDGRRDSFSSKEEAWDKIKEWAHETGDKTAHVYIHGEGNRIVEEQTI